MVNQVAKRASLKKVRKRGLKGFAYITATFNNTFINITNDLIPKSNPFFGLSRLTFAQMAPV